MAILLLLIAKRFSSSHLIGATGSAWGIKLVITSALYFGLARGPAHPPMAALPTASAKGLAPASTDYAKAKGPFASGNVEGSVLFGKSLLASAVIFIEKPRPGLPVSEDAAPFQLTIEASHYRGLIYVGRPDSTFFVESKDSTLHTLHLYEHGRAIMNVPVPVGGQPHPFAAPEPGIYEALCDTHKTESATIVVVDHPYVVRASEDGKFELRNVPEGPITLTVVARRSEDESASLVRRIPARVEANQTTPVNIDLSNLSALEERL